MNVEDGVKKNQRFVELDALRGIAVLMVLLSHYTWAYDYHFKTLDEHSFHFIHGDFGVQIFFIISGFVIFMTLEKSHSVKHFAVSRFARLYPTYWVAMLLTIAIITIFPVPTLGEYTFKEVLLNFSMLQGFFHVRHIDQVYWSLAVELLFYIIVGLLLLVNQLKRIEYYSIGWLIIVVVTHLFDFPYEKYVRILLIVDWAPLFITGMMFYKIKFKTTTVLNHIIIVSSLLVFMFSLNKQLIAAGQVDVTILHFVLIALAYLVFYSLMYFDIAFFRNRILLFFGFISYPLYLLHNVIGYSIIYRLKSIYDHQLFYFVVTSAIVILLAYIVTIIMERPSRIIRKKLDRYLNVKQIEN